MRNVVLIHGFWHGSWCWSLVTEQLAGWGIPSVAVDLDGHGLKSRPPVSRWDQPFQPGTFATEPSGVADVTASSAAATLVEQIRMIGGGEPCVVVVHGMSGTVATAAAEMEPSLFAHLVYVCAFAPVTGPAGEYVASPQNEGSMVASLLAADPAVVGAERICPGDRGHHALIREALYGDVDDATGAAAISLLGTDGPVGISTEAFTVTPERYGAVPHTYVICTKDNAVPVALQRRFVDEINAISRTPTAVIELDSAHSPFLSRPGGLAAAIAGASMHRQQETAPGAPGQFNSASDFNAAYSGRPPWEIGHPQPALAQLSATFTGRVLDVGCGTGEHALLAASLGLRTTGIDTAPAAIEIARQKAAERNLTARFEAHDALDLPSLGEQFDTVIDSALFHVFSDEEWVRYEAGLRAVVPPGGRYLMICFSTRQEGGAGPRRVSEAEIRHVFGAGWRIDALEPVTLELARTPEGAQAWRASITRV